MCMHVCVRVCGAMCPSTVLPMRARTSARELTGTHETTAKTNSLRHAIPFREQEKAVLVSPEVDFFYYRFRGFVCDSQRCPPCDT